MQLPALQSGTLLRRYKRFLADVQLPDGQVLTCHCPNTGAMTGCAETGIQVWLSHHDNPKRKYAYSWELTTLNNQQLICINTQRANQLVYEALQMQTLTTIGHCTQIQPEIKLGDHRLDFKIVQGDHIGYIEVKSVTLCEQNGQGFFPDAKSVRASAHLEKLIELKQAGFRSILLFCVQHTGIQSVQGAAHIDPHYAKTLQNASQLGVEILAYRTHISTRSIQLVDERVPVLFDNAFEL